MPLTNQLSLLWAGVRRVFFTSSNIIIRRSTFSINVTCTKHPVFKEQSRIVYLKVSYLLCKKWSVYFDAWIILYSSCLQNLPICNIVSASVIRVQNREKQYSPYLRYTIIKLNRVGIDFRSIWLFFWLVLLSLVWSARTIYIYIYTYNRCIFNNPFHDLFICPYFNWLDL